MPCSISQPSSDGVQVRLLLHLIQADLLLHLIQAGLLLLSGLSQTTQPGFCQFTADDLPAL